MNVELPVQSDNYCFWRSACALANEQSHLFKSVGFGDVLSLGALLVTVVALAFALYTVVKEFSTRTVERRMAALEERMAKEVSGLRLGVVVEEICGYYLTDSGSDRASEVQMIRVQLFRIMYSSNREEMLTALVFMNGYANPLFKRFYGELRAFYLATWESGRWRDSGLVDEFKKEFLDTFGEDVDAAVSNSYLWDFLRQPTKP